MYERVELFLVCYFFFGMNCGLIIVEIEGFGLYRDLDERELGGRFLIGVVC